MLGFRTTRPLFWHRYVPIGLLLFEGSQEASGLHHRLAAGPPSRGCASVVVMLHGEGGSRTSTLTGLRPSEAVAIEVDGQPIPPVALATVDGGSGYWNPHPGDNPMGMVMDELIPMCQQLRLGLGLSRVGTMGISMGEFAEHCSSPRSTRRRSVRLQQ